MRLLSTRFCLLLALLLLASTPAKSTITIDAAAKALPDKLGSFKAIGPAHLPTGGVFGLNTPDEVGAISHAVRSYREDSGPGFIVRVVRTQTDSGAYALLTWLANGAEVKLDAVGTAGIVASNRVVFYKGENVVEVWSDKGAVASPEQLLQFARSFAATLEGDDELPVLVKHLPNWSAMQPRARYAVSLETLKSIVNQQPILDAVSFDGDAEAVAAFYGPSQLVIVEFSTPQMAGDNDRRITPKIEELRSQGQPNPSAYRRVGNYSVFVFNSPDEKTANELIDQVKYEKVVRWLGDNPHWYEKAVKEWAETSAGVMVTVLKSSGLSVIICLGLGGAIGALLFRRRRALQREAHAYSDAGDMVRLNLDELTGEVDPARLLTDGSNKR